MPTLINPDKRKKQVEASQQWPNKDFDWSGKDTVPENPSKASGVIVAVGTAFAFAALGTLALAETYRDEVPQVGRIMSVLEKPFVR